MINKVFKIFNMLSEVNVKKRSLPLFLSVQNVILTIVVLIFCNIIISNSKINDELNYNNIKLFYNLVIIISFVIISIYVPFYLSNILNNLVKNNSVDNMLSVGITVQELVLAVFLRGFFSSTIILVSAYPISCVSFYFGGLGIIKIMCIFLYLILLTYFVSSVCIFISSNISDPNASILISYVISIVIVIINLYYLNRILNYSPFLLAFSVINILFGTVFLWLATRGKIFYL